MYKRLLFVSLVIFLLHPPAFAQTFKWAKSAGSVTSDYGVYIKPDNKGNFYVAGYFEDMMKFDSSGKTKYTVSYGAKDIYLAKFNCSRDLLWVNRIGGSGNDESPFGWMGLDLDSFGHVFLTGSYTATAYFSSQNGHSQSRTSEGGFDIFFCRYDISGNLDYVVSSGSDEDDNGSDLKVSGSGNIYICGYFRSTAAFNSAPGISTSYSMTSTSLEDGFLAKYDSLGGLQWVTQEAGENNDIINRLFVDKQENIYVTGNMTCCTGGTAYFGTNFIRNTFDWGGFIAKADRNGNWKWVNGMGEAADEALTDVAVDEYGNVFTVGHFMGNSMFSSSYSNGRVRLFSIGSYDIVFAKLDSLGNLQWANVFGGKGDDKCMSVKLNKNNNLVIAGIYTGTASFGNFTISSTGSNDIFVCEIDKSGTPVDILSAGGTQQDTIRGIGTDDIGNIFVTGGFLGPATFGRYILKSTGKEETFIAKISPVVPFSIMANPTTVVCKDSTLIFAKNIKDTIGLAYQWLKNNAPLPGKTNDTIAVDTSGAGSYRLMITNRCNEIDTSQPIDIIRYSPSVNGRIRNICKGDSMQLIATGSVSYLWSPDTYLSHPNISNPYTKPMDTIVYVVKGVNGSCYSYDTIKVNVNSNHVVVGTDKNICRGDSVQLIAQNAIGYTWLPSTSLSDPYISSPYAKPSDTTTYVVIATDGMCETHDTISVFVMPTPSIEVGEDDTICERDRIRINAISAGNCKYLWTPGTGLSDSTVLNPYARPKVSTTYSLIADNGICKVTDGLKIVVIPALNINAGSNEQICIGDSVQLYAIGGVISYNWRPGIGISDTSIANPTVSPPASTNYIVSSGYSGCTYYDTVLVIVNQKPVVNAGTDQKICQKDSIKINSFAAQGSYSWQPPTGLSDMTLLKPYAKPDVTTTYVLTVNDGICRNTDSMTLTVIPALDVNAGMDQAICSGDSVQLDATGGLDYIWTPSTAMDNTTIADPKVSPAITTLYIVSSEHSGCKYTDTVRVLVSPKPLVNAGDNIEECKGQLVKLNATSSGADKYNWFPAVGLNDPGLLQPLLFISSQALTYTLTATNSSTGCYNSDTLHLIVDSVNAMFVMDKNEEVAPLRIHFTNQSSNIVQSTWFFDNEMTTAYYEPNPLHTFAHPGEYTVRLVVQSAEGCLDTMSVIIRAYHEKVLYIPSAFTPNGDNLNDDFVIQYDQTVFKKIEGNVWDRWGNKVYEFEMPGGKWWDGKLEGNYVPNDVYFYHVNSYDVLGQKKEYRGSVTLLH